MFEKVELYKGHTKALSHDVDFYSQFIGNHRALELFAGYGRVSNKLISKGHQLETVEILPKYAQCIDLPPGVNHVCNVLDFSTDEPFERIFVAADSFTLLTLDHEIQIFFNMLSESLTNGGQVALNIYHPDFWHTAIDYVFEIDGIPVKYSSDFDDSKRHTDKISVWFDMYEYDGKKDFIRYDIRVYEDESDFLPFIEKAGLRLVEKVDNFNRKDIFEPGWQDYIFEKIA